MEVFSRSPRKKKHPNWSVSTQSYIHSKATAPSEEIRAHSSATIAAGEHLYPLVEVAFWNENEDDHKDGRTDKGTKTSLEEDGVLNLAQGGFLDPDLAVEDLSDDIALLIFRDPGLIFVAVGTAPQCVQ